MNCEKPSNCAPCQDCPDPVAPLLPRCDVVLTDGVYTNATVTVEGGCIVRVEQGNAPLYQPDSCCAPVGSGGEGGGGLDGNPGLPGAAATISVGSVQSIAYGQPARVENVGTANAAILNFYIPRGEPGDDADSATGVTSAVAGIDIQNGLLKALPLTWPPVMSIGTAVGDITITFQKDPATGNVTPIIDTEAFQLALQAQIDAATADMQTQIDAINLRLQTCCP